MKQVRDKRRENALIYVAGNHEMEALNEGQHPEVRAIMQEMFKEGLVKYCHYDRRPESNGTFISHTKLNKPLVEIIGNNNIKDYNDLFEGDEPNRTLKKIETTRQREQLAKLLNENFAKTSKEVKINKTALFDPNPGGISDFAIVGEELERTYFRGEENCKEAIEIFKGPFSSRESANREVENNFKKLEALEKMALGLAKNKIKDAQSNEINNFFELNNFVNTTDDLPKTFNFELKEKDEEDKEVKKQYSIEISQDKNITVKKENSAISEKFTLEEAGQLFAQAINSNPNSRPYSLMNRVALCNFSGGLFGYENDHPEEALDLGCSHVVGHRPTLLQKGFVSLNIPIVKSIEGQTEKSLQSDYNGKNEDKYINCRITKFDSEGKPHLVGISKMLEKHREFFKKSLSDELDDNRDVEIEELCGDVYKGNNITDEKRNKFVEYFKKNPPIEKDLKKYFEAAGRECGLTIKAEETTFVEAVNNFDLIKKYQEAFSENRGKIIDKQENIKRRVQGQRQTQEQAMG